uniref:DUF5641 domain-containing protein n=1 Tax=Heliothis virescens TaxID=7102 RepID=A0A2A4JVN0_HELVI
MPVTRSQKNVPVESPTRRDAPATAEKGATSEEVSSATASTATTGTEETSATGITECTTATGTTEYTTATEATETTEATEKTVAAAVSLQKKAAATKRKTSQVPGITPEVGGGDIASKKPAGAGLRTRSVKTTSSSARRRELEAKEELARLELQAAQAATKLARVRLELAQFEEEDSDIEEDAEERTAQVQGWIRNSVTPTKPTEDARPGSPEPPPERPQQAITKEEAGARSTTVEIQTFTAALRDAFGNGGAAAAAPKYLHELPLFDGSSGEWTAFRVVYEDTAPMFSTAQNMARLRRAVRGAARDAVKSLLYSEAAPGEVMLALKRRFGRPDALVLSELDKVRALPRISESPRDICVFASQINNSVAAIRGLGRPQYLCSPEIVKQIVDKLPTVLKFRWYDYSDSAESGECSDLTAISKFLNREADKCGAFATSESAGVRKVPRQSTNQLFMDGSISKDTRANQVCPMCNSSHILSDCRTFLKASVDDRWESVKKAHLCYKCLKERHRKSSCKKPPCKICKRWHHYLLHSDNRSPRESNTDNTEVSTNVIAPAHALSATRAYLKMVPVEIYGRAGSKRIMALLDEGSTVSLLNADVAREIGASGDKEELVIETVGGATRPVNFINTVLHLTSQDDDMHQTIKKHFSIESLGVEPKRPSTDMEARAVKGEEHWPAPRSFKAERTGEEKPVDTVTAARSVEYATPDPARFSSWTRLLRATARMLQFVQLCRRRAQVHACRNTKWHKAGKKQALFKAPRTLQVLGASYVPLDVDLLQRAERLLLERSQQESFAEDLQHLRLQQQLERGSKLRRLDVVLEEGAIKLRGRIDAVQGVSLAYRRPLVLDGRHRVISGRASATDIRVGDVVLIADNTLPRCTWPRGKVTAAYPGPDGRTRVVDVATRGGVLRRPATRLVVLVEAPGESPSREVGAVHEGETVGDEGSIQFESSLRRSNTCASACVQVNKSPSQTFIFGPALPAQGCQNVTFGSSSALAGCAGYGVTGNQHLQASYQHREIVPAVRRIRVGQNSR